MAESLVRLEGVRKAYGKDGPKVLRGVDLEIAPGQAMGLTGPSGVGKSTLANLLLGLERPEAGRIVINGRNTARLGKTARRQLLREIQIIWQDPRTMLNPFMSVSEQVAEPLVAFNICPPRQAGDRALRLLADVGLDAELGGHRPGELSGGQCQRAAIARALALEPRLLICDEAMASLDPVGKKQICGLLDSLRRERGIALLVISHDLSVLEKLCPTTVIMVDGTVVAHGPSKDLFTSPDHAFLRELAAAQLRAFFV